MKFEFIFLEKAKSELLETWIWYEERQEGLGERFKEKVFECINNIEQNPYRYPERKKNYREGLVDIFLYLIIYRVLKRRKLVLIVSVFHTKRNYKLKYKRK